MPLCLSDDDNNNYGGTAASGGGGGGAGVDFWWCDGRAPAKRLSHFHFPSLLLNPQLFFAHV